MSVEGSSVFAANASERKTKIGETTVINYSDVPLGRAINFFPRDLRARKIVLMPDLNPGRAPLPTGCSVEIEETVEPDWRRLTISDVGCGMQLLATDLTWSDFDKDLANWDEVFARLKANKGVKGDLGSGNHFLDAAVNDDEDLFFVIHTGSRNESSRVDDLVDQPEEFDRVYQEVQEWARGNRDEVRNVLERIYGPAKMLFDQPHNSIRYTQNGAIIYKGSVNLRPGNLSIIPSSMDSDMVIVEPLNGSLAEANNTITHGTGRLKSRSASKDESRAYDFESLRKRIYIPDGLRDESIVSEIPPSYRDLDACLRLIGDLVKVRSRLHPIAYIGQV